MTAVQEPTWSLLFRAFGVTSSHSTILQFGLDDKAWQTRTLGQTAAMRALFQGDSLLHRAGLALLPALLLGSPPFTTLSADLTGDAVAQARRVVFIGDSITYAGGFVDFVESWVRIRFPESRVEILNLGLPSETVSGLSEPGHAGGAFPRPDLHERLGRLLDRVRPDLMIASYGMNDAIYYPFSEDRFARFRDGVLWLRASAQTNGVRLVHLTPPVFDPVPLEGKTLPAGLPEYPQPYAGYNAVLDRYSAWLVAQRTNGWDVVDIHEPLNRFLAEQRLRDRAFTLANDGVHPGPHGHWLIAREILRHFGAPREIVDAQTPEALAASHPRAPAILQLVAERQRLLKDT